MDYTSLLSLSNPGIMALVNHTSKSVYLVYTTDVLYTVSRITKSLKDNTHECLALQADYRNFVLEVPFLDEARQCPVEQVKGEYNAAVKSYTDKGYVDLRDGYTPGSYKLRAIIQRDFRKWKTGQLVYVCAVSNRNNKTVIGVFESMGDAKGYIAQLSPTPESIVVPKRNSGDLTRLYFSKLRGR